MRKVIYTCLIGNYDELRQPLIVDDSYDYVCFSNDIQEKYVGVWEIRSIPFNCKDKVRLSRYVKLLPHRALPEYDYSLWIDANIQITGNEIYEILDNKILSNGKIFQVPHLDPPEDCVYDEIKLASYCGRCGYSSTVLQYFKLKNEGFPSHWGLYENNIILRKHNDEFVISISEKWWMEFSKFTKRDQFCLMYVYWLQGYHPDYLLDDSKSARNVDFFKLQKHNRQEIKGNVLSAKLKAIKIRALLYSLRLIDLFYK